MNALVSFRANAVGNLSVNRGQQKAAQAEIASVFSESSVSARPQGLQAGGLAKAASGQASVPDPNELSRDAFLQLLVMQLQNQDPTNPMDNTEMITQLAQFATLEAQTALNASFEELNGGFEALVGNLDQLNFISAQSLLGTHVRGIAVDGTALEGVVESVHLEGSIVVLSVDGEFLPMSGVLSVSPGVSPSGSSSGATKQES